ncbi:uncharacterized protein LOC111522572 [Piliocolobus tephrosceles]|uniref:uncharacterized protein LOC111522572 n=1 Tax=Piliocolobus tephrosceles TaxID=591936 RepID=UPI000C2A1E7A|nr:uncharacterized protein LOC111522572 [Piliocolobus tephrosceles]XP_023042445.1 uncharacterized protein LOC111522572 [Piliocolobus tephrosceles]
MRLVCQRIQGPRAQIVCQILGSCLIRLTCSHSTMDWAHTYADVTNVSNCWICSTLPAAAANSLPWNVYPASVKNWTWLEAWGPTDNGWDATGRALDRGHHKTHGKPAPWLTPSVHDGWGWLMGEHVVPPLQVSQCIEQHWGKVTVGWLPTEVCANVTCVTSPRVWWNKRPYQG